MDLPLRKHIFEEEVHVLKLKIDAYRLHEITSPRLGENHKIHENCLQQINHISLVDDPVQGVIFILHIMYTVYFCQKYAFPQHWIGSYLVFHFGKHFIITEKPERIFYAQIFVMACLKLTVLHVHVWPWTSSSFR